MNREKHQYYDKALKYLIGKERFNTAQLKEHLNIGYNSCGRLIDELEEDGIIGEFEGASGRKVLINQHL